MKRNSKAVCEHGEQKRIGRLKTRVHQVFCEQGYEIMRLIDDHRYLDDKGLDRLMNKIRKLVVLKSLRKGTAIYEAEFEYLETKDEYQLEDDIKKFIERRPR